MDEAEALLTSALAMRRRVFEPGHPDLTESLGNVAYLLENLGRVVEAEPLHREFLASYRSLPAVHAAIGGAVRGLAANLGKQGKWREAETVLRDRLAAIEGLVPETDPEWYRTAARLGHVLSRGEDKEEAERLLTRGYDLCLEGRPQDSTMVAGWLAELLDGLGRKEEAAVWSARARPVVGQ
jgi:predicted RNase H-like HicB family nuclease